MRVATLDIGGNDLLGLLRPVSPCVGKVGFGPRGGPCSVESALDQFGVNYEQIIRTVSDALASDPGHATLLVTTYFNPCSGTGGPLEAVIDRALLGTDGRVDCDAQADPASIGLNDAITCTAKPLGARVVDRYPIFQENARLLAHVDEGDIHPNDRGHAAIASAIDQAAHR